MLIYQRYIFHNIAWPYVFCLSVITGILWLNQILKLIFLFERQIFISEFIFLTTLIIPSLLHGISPFAILYATIFGYNRLKINKELTAFEACGIDKFGIITPIIKLSGIITMLAIFNASIVMPFCFSVLKDKVSAYRNSLALSVVEEGMFTNLSKKLVLFLNNKSDDGNFHGIILFDYRNSSTPAILFAKDGSLSNVDNNFTLNLSDGYRQSISKSGGHEFMSFEKFKVNLASEKYKKRGFFDKDILEHYLWYLLNPYKHISEHKARFIAEGHSRIVWSLMNILLPFFSGVLFIMQGLENTNGIKYVIFSIGLSMLYVLVHFLALASAFKNSTINIILYLNILTGLAISYFLANRKY
ncbi:MAG: LptF/LptG family permease [Rickettsiaceae bacterium]|nr:LptF/LptG family permease [Rickettsiaceae bacterium]